MCSLLHFRETGPHTWAHRLSPQRNYKGYPGVSLQEPSRLTNSLWTDTWASQILSGSAGRAVVRIHKGGNDKSCPRSSVHLGKK